MIHQWVPIDQCSLHLYQLDITVPKSKSVVKYVAISLVSRLTIAILANDVLDCVNFLSTMIGVYNDVASATVGRLNNAHDLSGTLGGYLLPTLLLCSCLLVVILLVVALIVQILLALLLRVTSLLFGRNYCRDYVRARTLLSTRLNV